MIRHSRESSAPRGGAESIFSAKEPHYAERGTSPRATQSNHNPVNRHEQHDSKRILDNTQRGHQ